MHHIDANYSLTSPTILPPITRRTEVAVKISNCSPAGVEKPQPQTLQNFQLDDNTILELRPVRSRLRQRKKTTEPDVHVHHTYLDKSQRGHAQEDEPAPDLGRLLVKLFPFLLSLAVAIFTALSVFHFAVASDKSDERNVLTAWTFHLCGPDTLATYGTWVEAYCYQIAPEFFPHLSKGSSTPEMTEICSDLFNQRLISQFFAIPSTVWAVLGNPIAMLYAFMWRDPFAAASQTTADVSSYVIAAASFGVVGLLGMPLWCIMDLFVQHRYCGARYTLLDAGWHQGSASWWFFWTTVVGSLSVSAVFLGLHQRSKCRGRNIK